MTTYNPSLDIRPHKWIFQANRFHLENRTSRELNKHDVNNAKETMKQLQDGYTSLGYISQEYSNVFPFMKRVKRIEFDHVVITDDESLWFKVCVAKRWRAQLLSWLPRHVTLKDIINPEILDHLERHTQRYIEIHCDNSISVWIEVKSYNAETYDKGQANENL